VLAPGAYPFCGPAAACDDLGVSVAAHARPFIADRRPVGIVLAHGFTGSPSSLRPWAEYLAEHQVSVRVPRLPGHGTTWQEMNRTRWPDWYAEVDRAFRELRERTERVFVGGLSMGGCLALRLAQEHDRDVAGIILVNPYVHLAAFKYRLLPFARFVLSSVPAIGNDVKKPGVTEDCYDRSPLRAGVSMSELGKVVRTDLAKITQPLLMFRSSEDHVIDPLSGRLIMQRVSSRDLTERVLDDSYHVATLDNDAELIFKESLAFIERVHAVDR
jgi:carboxylesterase